MAQSQKNLQHIKALGLSTNELLAHMNINTIKLRCIKRLNKNDHLDYTFINNMIKIHSEYMRIFKYISEPSSYGYDKNLIKRKNEYGLRRNTLVISEKTYERPVSETISVIMNYINKYMNKEIYHGFQKTVYTKR